MHLMFVPVVHTKDKEGNDIDKICARDFWKGRDSYRKLQDAYFYHVKSKGFDLERGMFVEDTDRKHYTVEEYKKITNYENTKKILSEMKLELPEIPDITDIGKFTIKRDEKILEKIIKPKDDLIKELYCETVSLNKELSKQSKVVDEAVKYQKERNMIMADNRALHLEVNNIKKKYKEKEFDLKWDYENEIKHLEKENNRLNKIIDKFYKTIDKFIDWVCNKFGIRESKELVKTFQEDTHTFIDPVKQLDFEKKQKELEWDLER